MKNLSSDKKSSPHSKILGIGTPLLDQIIPVSQEYLVQHSLERGSTGPIDYISLNHLITSSGNTPVHAAGGSAANTVKGLGCLGNPCTLFGKIGSDQAGKLLIDNLKKQGVESLLKHTDQPTGQVLCLITPDQERTMRYFLGAGITATADDITVNMFKDTKLVHTEGYLFNNGSLLERILKFAKEAGATVSLDASSVEMVETHKQSMLEFISRYVDILFANETEAHALTDQAPEMSVMTLSQICPIAVVKMGAQGCWVASGKEKVHHPAFNVQAIDTTGAGDLFASGFLHGYLRERSLMECAYYGNLIAAQVVQVIGAEIPDSAWKHIKNKMLL